MAGHAGSTACIVHATDASVTLTRSKVKVNITGLLNFQKLVRPCMLAAMTISYRTVIGPLFNMSYISPLAGLSVIKCFLELTIKLLFFLQCFRSCCPPPHRRTVAQYWLLAGIGPSALQCYIFCPPRMTHTHIHLVMPTTHGLDPAEGCSLRLPL